MRRTATRRHTALPATILATLMACGHDLRESTFEPPPSEIRDGFAAVAVVPIACTCAYDVPTPAQGAGAGTSSGAEQGALWGATPGMMLCATFWGCILGAPAALAGAIVGAVPGAIVGAGKAHSAEEVTAAEALLRRIITETPADEQLATLVARQAAGAGVAARVEPAEKSATSETLANRGFTSALHASVMTFNLIGEGALFADTPIDPNVSLVIAVRVRIERFGQPEAWTRYWFYRAPAQSFFDLAASDGSRLRQSIDAGLSAIAGKIVTDVFLSDAPQTYSTPVSYRDIPPGTVWPIYYIPSTIRSD